MGELELCYDVPATREGAGQCLVAVRPGDRAIERALRELMIAHSRERGREGVHSIAAA